jgi:hypothetical protein
LGSQKKKRQRTEDLKVKLPNIKFSRTADYVITIVGPTTLPESWPLLDISSTLQHKKGIQRLKLESFILCLGLLK